MGKGDPTPKQFSSRLAYNAQTPSFLRKLQNRVAGHPEEDEEEDREDREWEQLDPNRPAIPVRPSGDSEDKWRNKDDMEEKAKDGDEEDDFEDERPVVVVLKEGKHLTVEQVENEKRIAKGLPPLPPKTDASASKSSTAEKASGKPSDPLSFSTKTQNGPKKPSTSKRKAVGDAEPDDQRREKAPNKKKKKESKGLLSFGEGLE